MSGGTGVNEAVEIMLHGYTVPGTLTVPPVTRGLIVLACDPDRHTDPLGPHLDLARRLVAAGYGAVALDLLDERARDGDETDVDVAAVRLMLATRWLRAHPCGQGVPVGYFGSRAGATAAILAAAEDPAVVAVVAHDGRPDLAASRLGALRAATLLLVGSRDPEVVGANRVATRSLRCPYAVVEEPTRGLEPGSPRIAGRAVAWFVDHLVGPPPGDPR